MITWVAYSEMTWNSLKGNTWNELGNEVDYPLMYYVPSFLLNSKLFKTIYSNHGAEIKNLNDATSDVLNQFFIDSATWGLKYWEEFLGIPVDLSKDVSSRRSVIKSKIRGTGTVTVNLIKAVTESYDNGEIEVIEHPDTFSFEIKFISTRGTPPNIDDLEKAITIIKPAHLGVTYTFKYNTYQHLEAFTHAQLAGSSHNELREVI